MTTAEPHSSSARVRRALNRLGKWRTLLAGWQLGTRVDTDPECAAVKDTRELLLVMRAELTALIGLLIESNLFTLADFQNAVADEADMLSESMTARFPGVVATDTGLTMDPSVVTVWMAERNWKP